MTLWRIGTSTRTYRADDLSVAGAARSPGRWDDTGERVVYCAQTISLAVLETAAHIDDAGLPLNKYLIQIDIPEPVWGAREILSVAALGPTWAAIPAGHDSVRAGSEWFRSGRSALLLVPSVIVPEESAVLVNAIHAQARGITARIVRPYEYRRLFRK